MSIKKVTIAGIAGGVVAFFLGWLIFGILLMDFMSEHMNTTLNRPETEFIWWAMIASNLIWGITYAYIFNRWANVNSLAGGFGAGAIIAFLFCLAFAFSFYSMTTLYNDLTAVAVDVAANTVMGAVTGGVIGFVLGKIKD